MMPMVPPTRRGDGASHQHLLSRQARRVREAREDVLGLALLDLVRAAVAIGLEEQRAEPVVRWLVGCGPAAFPEAFTPASAAHSPSARWRRHGRSPGG